MNLSTIRTGIKTTLEASLTTVRVYKTATASISAPAIIITTGPNFIEYQSANAAGLSEIELKLTVLVPRQDEARAQEALDDYLSSGTGATKSIIDALALDKTLDGSVSTSVVTEASAYFITDIGDTTYASAALTLTAYAKRN